MSVPIHRLPFDILFNLIQFLSLEDAVHLAWASKQLSSILGESTLCRAVVTANAGYTSEARLAGAGKITFQNALQRLFRRRAAFSRLDPFLVRVVGHGSSLIYGDGVLCSVGDGLINIEDLQNPGTLRRTVSLRTLHLHCARLGYIDQYTVELLNYSHGILTVCLQPQENTEGHLLAAIEVPRCSRIMFVKRLSSINRLFVRNDSQYLYYGTHSRPGFHGYNEWVIQGVALDDGKPLPEHNEVQLRDFAGTDIGVHVVFKVHGGFFYALSNQAPTIEEVDWTSFYSVARFPLNDPSMEALQTNAKIYRRQHSEGPIHDSWSMLDLQHDEGTNALTIVEARREWLGGESKTTRSFYTQPVWFEEPSDLNGTEESSSMASIITQLPQDDLFTTVVTSANNPRYAPPQERSEDQVHREYGRADDSAPSFIIARTKLRTYNLSCASFIDLVEDDACCPQKPHVCIRLRLGSRRCLPSSLPRTPSRVGGSLDASQASKIYSPIALWPPSPSMSPCSDAQTIHSIMNPHQTPSWPGGTGGAIQVHGVCDKRSVVYMVKPARPRCEADRNGKIVLVAFDPIMRPAGGDLSEKESSTLWSRRPGPWPGQ